MSTTSQVESFCESCGTRYAFEPRRSPKRHLVRVGQLVGLLADDSDVDDSVLAVSRDPFHGAFHFCLECRRFTCPTCWDAAAGFCRSCAATLSGGEGAPEPVYTLDPETEALLRSAFDDLGRLGSGEAWQRLDPPPAARTDSYRPPAELGEVPGDELESMIVAGVAAMEARQAAEAARLAAQAEQRRLAEELRLQEEAQRLAWEQAAAEGTEPASVEPLVAGPDEAQLALAAQAEADRLAWEQYEIAKAAWDKAEAERLAAEAARFAPDAEATGSAFAETPGAPALADEAQLALAAQAEADRLAWEQYEIAKAAWDKAEAERLAAEAALLTAEAVPLAAEAALPAAETLPLTAEAAQLAPDAEAQGPVVADAGLQAALDEAPGPVVGGAELAGVVDQRLEQAPVEGAVWGTLAGALGPDVAAAAAESTPPQDASLAEAATTTTEIPGHPTPPEVPSAPGVPPAPDRRPPSVPQVPPSHTPAGGAWQMGTPPTGMPGWVPPPPPGWRPPMAAFDGAPFAGRPGSPMAGQAQLRSGIRPCPRCELALSANARFCRRCGLPQG